MDQPVLALIVFLSSLHFSSATACLLKCKDNYMNEMSAEMRDAAGDWSVEMVTPLQALLVADGSKGRLERRLSRTCRLNAEYAYCLYGCGRRVEEARQILLDGQRAWDVICNRFINDTRKEFSLEILPCWVYYGKQMAYRCSQAAAVLQGEAMHLIEAGKDNLHEQLNSFCRSTHTYDRCFATANLEMCGEAAERFIIHLGHETSHTMIDLLDRTGKLRELPQTCRDWMQQKGLSRHRSRSSARTQRNSHPDSTLLSLVFLLLSTLTF